ncbi:hypothetical protein A6A22_18020 [Arthrobacter sp. OY3WO11]|nr:hypothetical protein A6A22_18020 [Arthrobacter sp. OY3WO11]
MSVLHEKGFVPNFTRGPVSPAAKLLSQPFTTPASIILMMEAVQTLEQGTQRNRQLKVGCMQGLLGQLRGHVVEV